MYARKKGQEDSLLKCVETASNTYHAYIKGAMGSQEADKRLKELTSRKKLIQLIRDIKDAEVVAQYIRHYKS